MAVEYYRGITEFGHVKPGVTPTDVPWGKTAEDGFSIANSITRESLFSGQDLAEVDSAITRVEMTVNVTLLSGDAVTLARSLGLPESAVEDDVLSVLADEIGTEEFHLYAIQPGPDGPVRFEFFRARVSDPGSLAVSKTAWMTPNPTFAIMVPASGPLWTRGPAV